MPNAPIVGMAATPDGGATGWWAPMAGSSRMAMPGSTLGRQPAPERAHRGYGATPMGGYWLVGAGWRGLRVWRCPFFGSAGSLHLNEPSWVWRPRRWRRLLAGGRRWRGLRVWRRPVLRLGRQPAPEQTGVGMATTTHGAATGWWPRTRGLLVRRRPVLRLGRRLVLSQPVVGLAAPLTGRVLAGGL